MEKKLRMTPEQVFEQAKLSVRYAKNACPDVEFSPEDGSRSDLDFLCRVLEAVIKEGATTINIPDTVGYAVPQQFGEFIKQAARKSSELGQGGLVACTATTTSAWRSPIRSPRCRSAARARSSAPSTASASAPATPRSRRW